MNFYRTVGVAPGTTTIQLNGAGGILPSAPQLPFPERSQWYPIDPLTQWQGRLPLGQVPDVVIPTASGVPSARRIRWDIIAIIGGGSLMIALAIGLVASALSSDK